LTGLLAADLYNRNASDYKTNPDFVLKPDGDLISLKETSELVSNLKDIDKDLIRSLINKIEDSHFYYTVTYKVGSDEFKNKSSFYDKSWPIILANYLVGKHGIDSCLDKKFNIGESLQKVELLKLEEKIIEINKRALDFTKAQQKSFGQKSFSNISKGTDIAYDGIKAVTQLAAIGYMMYHGIDGAGNYGRY
jgi:hypothetical protein